MADGFLNRWSKRKAGKQDDLVEQPKEAVQTPTPISAAEEVKPPASLEEVEKIDRFDPDTVLRLPDIVFYKRKKYRVNNNSAKYNF